MKTSTDQIVERLRSLADAVESGDVFVISASYDTSYKLMYMSESSVGDKPVTRCDTDLHIVFRKIT